jgi:formylglycine-generating enzyme required for sulfatase activity/predicted esterase
MARAVIEKAKDPIVARSAHSGIARNASIAIALAAAIILGACGRASFPSDRPAPRVSPKDGMVQLYVPAGRFIMGSGDSDALAFDVEKPRHKVYLDAYWIDKTEVTNAMFARFVAETGYLTLAEREKWGFTYNQFTKSFERPEGAQWRHPRGPGSDIVGMEDYPVRQVAREDAFAYATWAGRRLPTEAEWEKAARGTDGRTYPWGDIPITGHLANYADRNLSVDGMDNGADDGYAFAAPVGSYPAGASPYGALDMAGNVMERVLDRFAADYYSASPGRNPAGPGTGLEFVYRGGSWHDTKAYVRCAFRYWFTADARSDRGGFRLAETAAGPVPAPAPLPAISAASASALSSEEAAAFREVRSSDGNEFLIFGAAKAPKPDPRLDASLSVFLGRWEGYDFAPPVARDLKIVLAIQRMASEGGEGLLWAGTNLQYPAAVYRESIGVDARRKGGAPPSIAVKLSGSGRGSELKLVYDLATDTLRSPEGSGRSVVLTRGRSFLAYSDYPRYLEGKGIYAKSYKPGIMQLVGGKYLVYLPEGYDKDPARKWPLILFFHGSGDSGDNPYLLAKASPFMYVREKGPLPCVIAAPLLGKRLGAGLFPDSYLEGALDEMLSAYRIDPARVYATGLSLGGEAAYKIASLRPSAFAAIAPLAAFSYSIPQLAAIKGIPVKAIHGADDHVVPPKMGKAPADALAKAGAEVSFELLKGHDHDVWTDTYSDPAFYDWLLSKRR